MSTTGYTKTPDMSSHGKDCALTTESWTGSEAHLLLDRSPWLRVWEQEVSLPNGHRIESYILTEERDYAMVFAVTEDGRVPLVRQYKHGVRKAMLDLPAGYLDVADEAPLACAQRELLEETGYVCARWQILTSGVIDSIRGRTRAHLFLATGGRRVTAPHLDDSEDLVCTLHTPRELQTMVRRAAIESLASIAGIMLALDRLGTDQW
jgi:ADP-ribose pyrophosphatase